MDKIQLVDKTNSCQNKSKCTAFCAKKSCKKSKMCRFINFMLVSPIILSMLTLSYVYVKTEDIQNNSQDLEQYALELDIHEQKINIQHKKLNKIETELENQADFFEHEEMNVWILSFKEKNPNLKIPNISNINQ